MSANTVFDDTFIAVESICSTMVGDGEIIRVGRCACVAIGKKLSDTCASIAGVYSCITTSGNDRRYGVWYGSGVGNMCVSGTRIVCVLVDGSVACGVSNTLSIPFQSNDRILLLFGEFRPFCS